jgi:hypothetical protein
MCVPEEEVSKTRRAAAKKSGMPHTPGTSLPPGGLPPGEVRALAFIKGIQRFGPAPANRNPPAYREGEQRPPKKRRQRGRSTRSGDLVWRTDTLSNNRVPLLCRVVEKRQPFGSKYQATDGSTSQLFSDSKNEGFLELEPLSKDCSCTQRELEGVRHTDVVPLADGLAAVLASRENKLSKQLQLQLEAARVHLDTRYHGNTPPLWLPGVLRQIEEGLKLR